MTLTPVALNTALFVIVKLLPDMLKDEVVAVRLITSPSAQPPALLLSKTTAI